MHCVLQTVSDPAFEAEGASLWAWVNANALTLSFQHLSVMGTDEQKLMEGEDNLSRWTQLFEGLNDVNQSECSDVDV